MFKQIKTEEEIKRDLVQLDDLRGNHSINIDDNISGGNINEKSTEDNSSNKRDTYAFFVLLLSIIFGLVLISIAYIYNTNEPQRIGYLVFGVASFIAGTITYICLKRLSIIKDNEILHIGNRKRRNLSIFGYIIKARDRDAKR